MCVVSAAADKDDMTMEDPLGSDEEEEDSEDEEDGDSSSGSEEENDGEDDEEGGKLLKATLEARQAARAAGDHPLQESFRAAAAQLLEKYATADKKKKKTAKTKEQDPVSVESKGDSDAEQGIEDEAVEEEKGEEEEESEDAGALESSEEDEQDANSDSSSSGVSEDEPAESHQPAATQLGDAQRTDRQQAHAAAQSSGQSHAGLAQADDDVDDIPYTIAAPSSYAAFAQLAEGQGPARLALIIRRIRACNAIALATDNRRKLQASIPPLQHAASQHTTCCCFGLFTAVLGIRALPGSSSLCTVEGSLVSKSLQKLHCRR